MRSAARSLHSPVRLTFVLAAFAFATAPVRGDVNDSGEKSSFLKRLNPFAKKEEAPPPAPPPPPPVEKPKSSTPGPKPKVVTKSKSGSGTKSSSASKGEAKKSSSTSTAEKKAPTKPAEPAVAKKKEEEPAKPAAKPATAMTNAANGDGAEKKTTASATAGKKDGEFGHGDDDDKPATKPTPAPPTPSTPLPASSKNAGWQVVKISGRDYVTGESIHQFYRFSSYKVDGTHVWLKSNNLILKAQIGSQEMLINNIKFIMSYPVMESDGRALFSRLDLCKLIDPVLRPTYITDAMPFDTVVVDAGHGGHDTGARGIYGYEKDFAMKMAFSLKEALNRRGFKVVMTREKDTFITLSGRVAIANSIPNSIFVSLHFNSGGELASGIETFALTPQGSSASLERGGGFNAYGLTGNSHDSANIALATAVHAMVISKFKFVDRGIKRAQWSVLTGCKRPGILFEGGFVTNGSECRLIASDTYRQSVSTAIAEAIGNYRTALRGAMTNRR
ncbi:MAG: N-acetylmuramoyl-L-alanine amidase [Prosthecobacter sp.]|nr:N-acetylmuramoyl-L-alanine amidase [Prosthecobacter sp.]